MSSWRFLLLIPASCFIPALTWFLWPEIASFAHAATTAPINDPAVTPRKGSIAGENVSLSDADDFVQRAINTLKSPQARCLQTKIWQRASIGDVSYEAEGTYACAPRGRTRMDLETHTGDAVGKVRIISDGTRIVHAIAAAGSAWTEASYVDAWTIVDNSGGKVTTDQVRRAFLQGRIGGGPTEMLENTVAQFAWTKREKVKRAGHICIKLTGARKQAGDDATIAQCRLYLDAATLWPHRIEWWGNESSAAVFQIEYRDPVLAASLPSEKLESDFTIDAAAYPLQDQTAKIAALLVH